MDISIDYNIDYNIEYNKNIHKYLLALRNEINNNINHYRRISNEFTNLNNNIIKYRSINNLNIMRNILYNINNKRVLIFMKDIFHKTIDDGSWMYKTFTILWNTIDTIGSIKYIRSFKGYLSYGLQYELYSSYHSDLILNDDRLLYKLFNINNILMIDGDNIVNKELDLGRGGQKLDIGFSDKSSSIRLLNDNNVFTFTFYKYDGISSSLAYQQYINKSNNIQIIKSYGINKDAADVNIQTIYSNLLEILSVKHIINNNLNILLNNAKNNVDNKLNEYLSRTDINIDKKKNKYNDFMRQSIKQYLSHNNIISNINSLLNFKYKYIKIYSNILIDKFTNNTIDYFNKYKDTITNIIIDIPSNIYLISNDKFTIEMEKYGNKIINTNNIKIHIIDHKKRDYKWSVDSINPQTFETIYLESGWGGDGRREAKRRREAEIEREGRRDKKIYTYPYILNLIRDNISVISDYQNINNLIINYDSNEPFINTFNNDYINNNTLSNYYKYNNNITYKKDENNFNYQTQYYVICGLIPHSYSELVYIFNNIRNEIINTISRVTNNFSNNNNQIKYIKFEHNITMDIIKYNVLLINI